ncbi:MAG: hypothetical protein U1E65_15805 [Myxococcota bacterium]
MDVSTLPARRLKYPFLEGVDLGLRPGDRVWVVARDPSERRALLGVLASADGTAVVAPPSGTAMERSILELAGEAADEAGLSGAVAVAAIIEVLGALKLSSLARKVGALLPAERARLGVACALLAEPAVLLADDALATPALEAAASLGITAIAVASDQRGIQLADRVVHLVRGRLREAPRIALVRSR